MPCRIYLRSDQSLALRKVYSSNKVTIFAPSWVKGALLVLGEHLNGVTFELHESRLFTLKEESQPPGQVESFTITSDFLQQSLITLQRIARNEAHNVNGVINKTLYSDVTDRRILYSVRDLVRQCVIVGVDSCSKCGGYRCPSEVQNKERVYICDLAALQFQQPYNSGRLVLIQENEPHRGILDEFIFEKVVGERKHTFEEISSIFNNEKDESVGLKMRYIQHDGYGIPGTKSCFLDKKAYAAFVKLDVILSGLAILKMVSDHHPDDKILFKFLKYGTGFFAWKFASQLEKLILPAVLDGLEGLFQRTEAALQIIKCVELPFYVCDPKSAKRIEDFQSKYKIEINFGCNDALKQSPTDGVFVATTNCGDNHAVCGNEMGFGSVDAAIAENLESKGNIFCPNINLLMSEQYIDI